MNGSVSGVEIGVLVLVVVLLGIVAWMVFAADPSDESPADPPPRSAAPDTAPAADAPEPTPARRSDDEILAGLRRRFSEEQLMELARRSVAIEDAAREQWGESEQAYQAMAEGWARLCREEGLSEEERDALENEAIRQKWIGPPPD